MNMYSHGHGQQYTNFGILNLLETLSEITSKIQRSERESMIQMPREMLADSIKISLHGNHLYSRQGKISVRICNS